MTRKHFALIAEALRRARPAPVEQASFGDALAFQAWQRAVSNLAGALAGTNARFDRERFLSACGFDA